MMNRHSDHEAKQRKNNTLLTAGKTTKSDAIVIIEPSKYDILCGKDRECLSHYGSRYFRSVIEKNRSEYQKATTKQQKMKITKKIVLSLNQSSFRFLKYNAKLEGWQEISHMAARDKVSHALRFANRNNGIIKQDISSSSILLMEQHMPSNNSSNDTKPEATSNSCSLQSTTTTRFSDENATNNDQVFESMDKSNNLKNDDGMSDLSDSLYAQNSSNSSSKRNTTKRHIPRSNSIWNEESRAYQQRNLALSFSRERLNHMAAWEWEHQQSRKQMETFSFSSASKLSSAKLNIFDSKPTASRSDYYLSPSGGERTDWNQMFYDLLKEPAEAHSTRVIEDNAVQRNQVIGEADCEPIPVSMEVIDDTKEYYEPVPYLIDEPKVDDDLVWVLEDPLIKECLMEGDNESNSMISMQST